MKKSCTPSVFTQSGFEKGKGGWEGVNSKECMLLILPYCNSLDVILILMCICMAAHFTGRRDMKKVISSLSALSARQLADKIGKHLFL